LPSDFDNVKTSLFCRFASSKQIHLRRRGELLEFVSVLLAAGQGFLCGGLGSLSCFTQSPKSRARAASNSGPAKPERREASSSAALYRRNIAGFSGPEQNRKSYFAA